MAQYSMSQEAINQGLAEIAARYETHVSEASPETLNETIRLFTQHAAEDPCEYKLQRRQQ
jgi:hypothetical protein